MIFPPIKPDRALLWLTLQYDEGADSRFSLIKNALKQCRLHPLDTTAGSAILIVGTEAFNAHRTTIHNLLGPGDLIHFITVNNGRLSVEVIAGSDANLDTIEKRPEIRRPEWMHEG